MNMKKFLPLIILTLLASCTSEPLSREQGMPLEIVVDVAAYTNNISDIRSRASINSGVYTSFAPGDDFGIIVLDKNGSVINNNYRFVVQKTGLAYRVDEHGNVISSDIYYDENYKYIAYAPYNAAYDGYTSIDDIKAKHMADFATLYADQSTQAQYNAADLLVCYNPTRTGSQLRLSFTHAMGLMKIFYNGEQADFTIDKPSKSLTYKPDGSGSYCYLYPPGDDKIEVYGSTTVKHNIDEDTEIDNIAYWQTYADIKENHMTYISVYSQPEVSYKSAGVDMGFESGCIWAKYNLGSETKTAYDGRGGAWYDADGNLREDLANSDLHQCFDRGDYYAWGELRRKYERPALLFNEGTGRISATGEAIVTTGGTQTVSSLVSGSNKGYYPDTYSDRSYNYAAIDGNIAGTEYDVVRNIMWKGEWRIPNEAEVDELMNNSTIEVYGWYFEDNVRYAPWIAAKDGSDNYINLHPDNSEFYGTENVRPYRYLVTIFKFTSKINGAVLYIPGGTWSDWSIDMLCCNSRSYHGLISSTSYSSDYGGMYYFASSASHEKVDCASYMEMETKLSLTDGKISNVQYVMKTSTYVDKNGNTITLKGLTQNGHRYTGMLIRPVYGGKNWNTNSKSREYIRIKVE